MKNLLYNVVLAVLLLVVLGWFALLMYSHLSPSAFTARKNVKNLKEVQIGMRKSEVIEIMGVPSSRYKSYYNIGDSVWFYTPPVMASDGIEIHINNKSERVSTIVPAQ